MIITTTPSVEGRKIVEYCDVIIAVSGITHVSATQDSFTPLLEGARQLAFNKLQAQAEALGAHAVVGVDIDYEFVIDAGGETGSLVLSVSGTAVKLR